MNFKIVFGGTKDTYYFSGMKESVKIDSALVEKIRKESKKRGQTMGGFFELSAKQTLTPKYTVHDNSDAFRKYLDDNGIKYRAADHCTILVDIPDPIGFGIEWGMHKLAHAPQYKNIREHISDIEKRTT